MARSSIRRRQDAERKYIAAYEASLRNVSRQRRPAPHFEKALKEAKRGLANETIRDSSSWQPKMKSRDPARLRLAAARHLFARYPVPACRERVWLEETDVSRDEVMLRKRWYVIAARGGSLYKEAAKEWLIKKEVHAFLNPPGDLGFAEAFWYAIARSYTDDLGHASRIARSKIARSPQGDLPFWREAARFFCVNPVPLAQIDDLCDFLAERYRRDRDFSLKGRTLASLTRQMAQWHHDLAAIERIEAMRRRAARRSEGPSFAGRAWPGSPLADWEWQPPARDASAKGERFVVRQLKTAEDLVLEGRSMNHCVSVYAGKCVTGNASIWALRRCAGGRIDRLLTIELDRSHRALQVRGRANRLATADERRVLERWAKARGITLPY